MFSTKIYSPTQVALGSFLGGPLACVYFLAQNFASLGDAHEQRQTYVYGAVFVVVLLLIIPFLPEHFPNMAIPVAYAVTATTIVRKYQMSKEAIAQSESYDFQSNWKVFFIALGFLVTFAAISVAWTFALDQLGIIKL